VCLLGCRTEVQDDNTGQEPTPQDPNSYLVPGSSLEDIQTEYGRANTANYLFVVNFSYAEVRKIYVGGNNQGSGFDVWVTGQNGSSTYISERTAITKGENSHYDNRSGLYSVPVLIFLDNTWQPGTYSFTAYRGTQNSTSDNSRNTISVSRGFTVEVVTHRNYTLFYSYQTGYDLFDDNRSFELQNFMQKTYYEKGPYTSIIKFTEIGDLGEEEIDYNNGGNGKGFETYVVETISPTPDDDQNISRLIGAYKVVNQPPGLVGGTNIKPDAGPFVTGWSFVFYENIRLLNPGNLELVRKNVTAVTLHELGHLRGREERHNNEDHTTHNGVGKNNQCIMFDFGTLTNDEITYLFDNPYFCEGHKQYLFNKHE